MITKNLEDVIHVLKQEELVAIPTETVYGLAGNALSEKAINRIFKLKNRPFFNPLIAHIASKNDLNTVAKHIPEKAKILADKFWPGPLTMVLPKLDQIPKLLTANKETVAVRVPNHPLALALLRQINFPLAAPSANPFSSISPTTPKHVEDYFTDKLKFILDGGTCERGIESTIIGFEDENPVLYRLGSLSVEEIELAIGLIKKPERVNENQPQAPGMLSRHYAPKTKLQIVESSELETLLFLNKHSKIGVLRFQHVTKDLPEKVQEILSPTANLEEAAKNLYAAMHRLDTLELDLILAEKFPDIGIGKTINDKLHRAAQD